MSPSSLRLLVCVALFGPVRAAAEDVASVANGSACAPARPFYYEIGLADGTVAASGSVGVGPNGGTIGRDAVMPVASASKWVFGAYVFERIGGPPAAPEHALIQMALTMRTGHTTFSPRACRLSATVAECHEAGDNAVVDQAKVGVFHYGGGSGQYLAAAPEGLGLGEMTAAELTEEVRGVLGLGPSVRYGSPQVGGGLWASPGDYADFLRGLIDGRLIAGEHLGFGATATHCEGCFSPFGELAMHYSGHHWIEDHDGGVLRDGERTARGDGAYSSAGGFGFYPWVAADRSHYGLVAMLGRFGSGQIGFRCGGALRAAFVGGDG